MLLYVLDVDVAIFYVTFISDASVDDSVMILTLMRKLVAWVW